MATSFVTFDDTKGFWIHDSLFQVVCWGLVSTIDTYYNGKTSWMQGRFRDHIYNNSQGLFVGFMDLGLTRHLLDKDRINEFKNCIEKTKQFFYAKGDAIPIEELNGFQLIENTRSGWLIPLETKKVIEVLEGIENLFDDNIGTKVTDGKT